MQGPLHNLSFSLGPFPSPNSLENCTHCISKNPQTHRWLGVINGVVQGAVARTRVYTAPIASRFVCELPGEDCRLITVRCASDSVDAGREIRDPIFVPTPKLGGYEKVIMMGVCI